MLRSRAASKSNNLSKIATLLALCVGLCVNPLRAADFPQTVQVDTGTVTGVPGTNPAIMVFKGIPYAAPPVGKLRWQPPAPPTKWTGILNADHYGASCMQPARRTVNKPGEISEDCLYLNVWTPAKSANEKLPVMVWIYGGGFMAGSASNPDFDGEGLAAKGVVRVSLNYRLGIFGFLAHPELDKDSPNHVSGNYGLLDQIAALQWVKRNIAAFGGDPERVAIFGQSAGGGSVHFLSVSPMAKGLFRAGISENGLLYQWDPYLIERNPSAYKLIKPAEEDNLAYLKKAGIESLQQLRDMTAAQLVALPPAPFPPAFFSPIIDGWVLPEDFSDVYAKGKQNDVAMMAGWTISYYPGLKITVADYQKWAKARFGSMGDEFLKLYPASTDDEASQQIEQSARDSYRISVFLWAETRQKAQKKDSTNKFYIFSYNHPEPPDAQKRGAGAGVEIPYVMNSLSKLDRPFVKEDYEIADMMSSYWANFAKTLDPNGKGLPVWPAFNSDSRVTMQLGEDSKPISLATDARFSFFKRFLKSHPPICHFAEDCSINMQ
jgi:para-nitrobenzyl esterase